MLIQFLAIYCEIIVGKFNENKQKRFSELFLELTNNSMYKPAAECGDALFMYIFYLIDFISET